MNPPNIHPTKLQWRLHPLISESWGSLKIKNHHYPDQVKTWLLRKLSNLKNSSKRDKKKKKRLGKWERSSNFKTFRLSLLLRRRRAHQRNNREKDLSSLSTLIFLRAFLYSMKPIQSCLKENSLDLNQEWKIILLVDGYKFQAEHLDITETKFSPSQG